VLSKLPPQERRDVEDLVFELVFRETNAREQASDPEGYRQRREHAEAVVAAIGPVPPGAASAIREAWATVARSILKGEVDDAGTS